MQEPTRTRYLNIEVSLICPQSSASAAESQMATEIVIADDHEIVRVGLRTLLRDTGIRIVAEASDAMTALKLVKKHKPKLALLDVRMPELDGISCLGQIKINWPDVAVLMFSSFDSPTYLARSLATGGRRIPDEDGKSKADSECNPRRCEWRINLVWRRIATCDRSTGAPIAATSDDVHLTKRESEVLKQIAFGLTNKEIAQSLGISYETVKEHVQHILQKLAVSDRTQAAVWAVRRNLV